MSSIQFSSQCFLFCHNLLICKQRLVAKGVNTRNQKTYQTLSNKPEFWAASWSSGENCEGTFWAVGQFASKLLVHNEQHSGVAASCAPTAVLYQLESLAMCWPDKIQAQVIPSLGAGAVLQSWHSRYEDSKRMHEEAEWELPWSALCCSVFNPLTFDGLRNCSMSHGIHNPHNERLWSNMINDNWSVKAANFQNKGESMSLASRNSWTLDPFF